LVNGRKGIVLCDQAAEVWSVSTAGHVSEEIRIFLSSIKKSQHSCPRFTPYVFIRSLVNTRAYFHRVPFTRLDQEINSL
jgi:hypothetical protein